MRVPPLNLRQVWCKCGRDSALIENPRRGQTWVCDECARAAVAPPKPPVVSRDEEVELRRLQKEELRRAANYLGRAANGELRAMRESFHNLSREMKRERLHLIMTLSHQLVEAERKSRQATRLAEGMLIDVILGDLKAANELGLELRKDPGFVGIPADDNHLGPFIDTLAEYVARQETAAPEQVEGDH